MKKKADKVKEKLIVKSNLEKAIGALEFRIDLKLDNIKEEMETRGGAAKKHDKVMTTLDKIVGELSTIREEMTIGNYHFEELQKQVGN